MKLAVSEVFSSIQGEGITSGAPSVFLRLGGCNLMCGGQGTQFDKELHNGAKWRCDTIEVWMEAISKQIPEVLPKEQIRDLKRGYHLILTGGEPLMQQRGLEKLLEWLEQEHDIKPIVEVETNGTVEPEPEFAERVYLFNVSPKLSNSGNERAMRFKPEVLRTLTKYPHQFKYVIAEKEDWQEVLNEFVPIHGTERVVLMPAGDNQKELEGRRELVANIAITECVWYTDRLHIVLWNQKTGV